MVSDDSLGARTKAPGDGFTADTTSTESESVPEDTSTLTRGEWWAAIFWLLLGVFTLAVVIPTAGFQWELLAPGVILVFYGLFVLWNPDLARSDASWTGLLWIVLGILSLIVLQAIDLYWPYHVTGILIGFFLIFAGMLVLLDL